MATNTINARVKHKIGTADEWQTAATNSSFKPLEGELIIYEDATTPRLKVGDGSKLVTELPFIDGIKVTVSGSGNAITAASYDENTRTLTLTKGASYTNNTGDITGVTAGNGLTGGATSGNATLNVGAGSGITVAADTVSVNTSYTTSGKNYKVAVDGTTGGLYVNVPWTDNNTDTGATTVTVTGTGNAITAASYDSSTRTITLTKGATYNNYTLSAATSSTLGGVRIGNNITVSSGTISLTKNNVIAALGYTPPTTNTNTTYTFATGSTNGAFTVTPSGGSAQTVSIKGLGSNAYTSTAYLPLAGGTMTGTITIPATSGARLLWGQATDTNTTYNIPWYGLSFYNDGVQTGNVLGLANYWGINFITRNAADSLMHNGSVILNASNYSSYALPLTGGTLTGQLNTCSVMAGSSSSNTIYTLNVSRLGSDGTTIGRMRTYVASDAKSGIIDFLSNGTSVCSLNLKADGTSYVTGAFSALQLASRSDSYPSIYITNKQGTQAHLQIYANASSSSVAAGVVFRVWSAASTYSDAVTIANTGKLYGAVWNDYAEYREQMEDIKPGYIAYCDDDGKLKLTTERLQKFEGVVSDTYGFAIGKNERNKTPIAVSGRALVYANPEEEFHSGDCVCAGPNGLAYRMTEEEIVKYPNRIVGVVSEIPTYETWGETPIEVNGRIWIKVK